MIEIKRESCSIFNTIVSAIDRIYPNAEEKQIEVWNFAGYRYSCGVWLLLLWKIPWLDRLICLSISYIGNFTYDFCACCIADNIVIYFEPKCKKGISGREDTLSRIDIALILNIVKAILEHDV